MRGPKAVIPPSGEHAGAAWRPKAVGEALRTVARAWASDKAEREDDRGPGRQRASRGWGGPRGPNLQARAHGGRWMGLAGPEAWSRRKASGEGWAKGSEMSAKRDRTGRFNSLLPWPPATTDRNDVAVRIDMQGKTRPTPWSPRSRM